MARHKLKFIKISLLLLVFSFATQSFGQQTDPRISNEEAFAESVKLAPCTDNDERLESVKKLFAKNGANDDQITLETFKEGKIKNIVLKKKGKSDETIIIGAHYDKSEEGCGSIDNWTGISILAHLFKTISQIETEKSYIFVAFDKEEVGLLGSNAMAKAIPKEDLQQYCAMVNFDSFGFAFPFALQNTSDSKLISIAKELAKKNEFKLVDVNILGAQADSLSFKRRDIPSITLSGLNGDWQNYLHSKNDKIENINMKSVYLGYRFGLVFIAKLDSMVCREMR